MAYTRRALLGAAGAIGTLAAAPAFARWMPTERYPDPAIQILDPSFGKYRIVSAAVERLGTGYRWAEGPVWFGDGGYLLWSDIPNNRILRWDETTGVSVFRKPAGFPNGHTRDRQGRLISCEHELRRVSRTEYDGTVTTLVDRFEGKPLNSPNDVVVKSDDSIWFTDPPFGILGNYEGHVATPELPTNVYRFDPRTKAIAVVAGDVVRPNGLAFSPDERKLYVIEAGTSPRIIRAYEVSADGTRLGTMTKLIDCGPGTADGMKVDVDGNLWVGWGMGEGHDGVMIFNPEGKPIGKISLPERCANLCFGGVKRNRLFMASSQSLYSLYVGAQGAIGG